MPLSQPAKGPRFRVLRGILGPTFGLAAAFFAAHCSSAGTGGAPAGAPDAASDVAANPDAAACPTDPDTDGVNGGNYTFQLTVSDTAFSTLILKAQNDGMVTLSLMNTGTKPHDFVVRCMQNAMLACQYCFPGAAKIPTLAPGASMTTSFATPDQEGIYVFASDLPGDDALTGQFILQ
jgi:hypothetical protein